VQYWGRDFTAALLSAAPHDLLIVEASVADADRETGRRERRFSASEVRAMRRGGARPVLAYLNLGEVEPWRDHWVERGAAWIAGVSPTGERLAPYWDPDWARMLKARLDVLLALGFDGALLDDALHYWTWGAGLARVSPRWRGPRPPSGAPAAARAMLGLTLDLADHARRRSALARADFALVVNNGVFLGDDAAADGAPGAEALFARHRAAMDAILVESALARSDEAALGALARVWRGAGAPVLAVEFASEARAADPAAFRRRIAREAECRGFAVYVADDPRFDRLYPPVVLPDPA
jgi:Predicted extracellular endo alpha-1,4 polygalactosaminidase or related polysaccharide hydrolase